MLCLNVFKCQMPNILQSNVSGVLLNIACTEQSNCTTKTGKGSPRGTIDEIAIYSNLIGQVLSLVMRVLAFK